MAEEHREDITEKMLLAKMALAEKLELEKQDREERITILNALDTKRLIEQIPKLQLDWERAVREDIAYRNINSKNLASYTSDCAEVKSIMAELMLNAPDNISGKKFTQAEREAWLELQRTRNEKLLGAISMQNSVTMMTENNRVGIEIARKKLDSVLAVLALRTAQIEFLA